MDLKRYNERLFAALGTLALLLGAGVAGLVGYATLGDDHGPELIVTEAREPRPRQTLVFCTPTLLRGSGLQLLPVAVVREDGGASPVFASGSLAASRSAERGCGLGHWESDGILNVVVRDPRTNEQRLLLERPAQIAALHGPDADCAAGKGDLPCGLLQWHIRTRDTNSDGAIDEADAVVAFHSDLAVSSLREVTPPDATLLGFRWQPSEGALLFQVRDDSNQNGEFDAGDRTRILELKLPSESPPREVIDPAILSTLEAQLG